MFTNFGNPSIKKGKRITSEDLYGHSKSDTSKTVDQIAYLVSPKSISFHNTSKQSDKSYNDVSSTLTSIVDDSDGNAQYLDRHHV